MIHERFELYSREGEILRADLRYEPTGAAKPAIVFLHGFKGFKDWGPFPAMLEALSQAGFITLAFNFSHNGIGEDLLNFTELDRFAHNTFTRELEETGDVIRALAELNSIPLPPEELDPNAIGLMGHSRGAAIAILAGAELRLVRAIAALSPVSDFNRYSERQKEKWRSMGYFEVLNQRTKQVMRLDVELLEDLERNRERLDILKAARNIARLQKPLLLLAGEQDLTTKPEEAETIARAADGPFTELQLIPNTGHTFGAEHPFTRMGEPMRNVIESTEKFFKTNLYHGTEL
ncbi:MAG: alpha/beta hydrolase family protein [Candidatus Kapaibacterium sp.]